MAQSILIWLKSHDLASTWADVAGLLGFVITICVAIGAKRAAKAAKNAAEATRDKIRFYESAVDFQSAILGLEEIKKLHRQKDWVRLPEKYAQVRHILIALRSSGVALDDNELIIIQSAVTNLSNMERAIDSALARSVEPRGEKFNPLVSENADSLLDVLQKLKQRGGGA